MSPKQVVVDIAERVGWTFAQTLMVVLVSSGSAGLYAHTTWEKGASTAAWAALFSLCLASLAQLTKWHPVGTMALVDRAARTFLVTFSGVMASSTFTSITDAGAKAALATAVATSFLAVMRSLIGLANSETYGDSSAVPVGPTQPVLPVDDKEEPSRLGGFKETVQEVRYHRDPE